MAPGARNSGGFLASDVLLLLLLLPLAKAPHPLTTLIGYPPRIGMRYRVIYRRKTAAVKRGPVVATVVKD